MIAEGVRDSDKIAIALGVVFILGFTPLWWVVAVVGVGVLVVYAVILLWVFWLGDVIETMRWNFEDYVDESRLTGRRLSAGDRRRDARGEVTATTVLSGGPREEAHGGGFAGGGAVGRDHRPTT